MGHTVIFLPCTRTCADNWCRMWEMAHFFPTLFNIRWFWAFWTGRIFIGHNFLPAQMPDKLLYKSHTPHRSIFKNFKVDVQSAKVSHQKASLQISTWAWNRYRQSPTTWSLFADTHEYAWFTTLCIWIWQCQVDVVWKWHLSLLRLAKTCSIFDFDGKRNAANIYAYIQLGCWLPTMETKKLLG